MAQRVRGFFEIKWQLKFPMRQINEEYGIFIFLFQVDLFFMSHNYLPHFLNLQKILVPPGSYVSIFWVMKEW